MTLFPDTTRIMRHARAAAFAIATMFLVLGLYDLARAQGFKPQKPVEFLVHTGPGGGNDVLARAVAGMLEKEKLLPVRSVVVNRTGGGGAIAMAHMMERKGDTHLIGFFTALWIGAPLTSKESRVQFRELTPIAGLIRDPAVIVVKADAPYKTLSDFIDAAKKSPGQLRQAGGSIESRDNLTRLLLQKLTGASWTFIPFPGGGERISALLGGHAQLYVADAGEIREYTRTGTARVIVQMVDKRLPSLPNVPTLKESGFDIPMVTSVRGVVGPPGIPKEVVEYWENVFERLSKTQMWQRYLEDNQVEDGFEKSAQIAKTAEELLAQRRVIYKEAGIVMYR